MIKVKTFIDVTLSPEELAHEFAEMDRDQQAIFFSELAEISKSWCCPFYFQMQTITDSKFLTNDGRWIMGIIGEYSSKM